MKKYSVDLQPETIAYLRDWAIVSEEVCRDRLPEDIKQWRRIKKACFNALIERRERK